MEEIMKEIELSLSDKQKEKMNEIIEYFKEVTGRTEARLLFDEDIEESKLALQKIEEAKFWAIKSVIKKGW